MLCVCQVLEMMKVTEAMSAASKVNRQTDRQTESRAWACRWEMGVARWARPASLPTNL